MSAPCPPRLLDAALVANGPDLRICRHVTQDWASVTFGGARHCLTVEVPAGPALDRWLASLPEADLPIRGHLVADVEIIAIAHLGEVVRIDLEILTVIDV